MIARVAVFLVAALGAGTATAGTDLALLLNKSEADARRALIEIALAPSVTGGVHELFPPSMSKQCTVKQLSTAEADVFLHEGTVTRVDDRRVRRVIGDISDLKAFQAEMIRQLGKVDVTETIDGSMRLTARRGDVAAYYIIRLRRDGAFELAAEGAEIVDASAKCDNQKKAAKEAAVAEARRLQKQKRDDAGQACFGGDPLSCREAVALVGWFDVRKRYDLASAGCANDDGELCATAAEAALDGRFVKSPASCTAAFAAAVKACRMTPTLLCAQAAEAKCLDVRATPEQHQAMLVGACVFDGGARADCEKGRASSGSAAARAAPSGKFCVSPSTKVARGSLAGSIGKPWLEVAPIVTKNLAFGPSGCGGDLIDNEHSLTTCTVKGKLVVFLTVNAGPQRAGGAAPLQQVADLMLHPKEALFVGRCSVKGRVDPYVVASAGDDGAVRAAWKVNANTHCFEELPVTTVKCDTTDVDE